MISTSWVLARWRSWASRWRLLASCALAACLLVGLVYFALQGPTEFALIYFISLLVIGICGVAALIAAFAMTALLIEEEKERGTLAQLFLGFAAVLIAVLFASL